jgi:VWFA-related protein
VLLLFARRCAPLLVAAGTVLSAAPQTSDQPQPLPQQRPPIFRAGAHYVRVDAYPTSRDGRIVEGLTKDDFEILEDGKRQTIESSEFITFDTWTPEAERRDPRTQEEGYALAADPTYRVFVIVIDRAAFDMEGWNVMRTPLQDFLERTLGPRDLFGLVSSRNAWTDLVLGQKTTAIERELAKREWWTTRDDPDGDEWALVSCGLEPYIPTFRADRTYSLLEGLVRLLGAIREERKSILFVANSLPQPGLVPKGGGGGGDVPAVGVTGGRLGILPRDAIPGRVNETFCASERQRLASLDFPERFRDLLKSARQSNVAFYPVSPLGLQTIPFTERAGADLAAFRAVNRRLDDLRSLASETDGVAIVNTNDLRGGMKRIADDLHAYYVLGYYTTNTKWDGRVRSIKVRLKGKETIRARRQYRAPTPEDIAAMSAAASPSSAAPTPGPAPSQGTPALVGEPIAYRVAPRLPPQKVSTFEFVRTDRVRIEWPVLGTLDRRSARLLDGGNRALPTDVPLSENGAGRTIVTELPMAAFARGSYALELTAGSGKIEERRLLAFRVK